jgi:hypothetical protein
MVLEGQELLVQRFQVTGCVCVCFFGREATADLGVAAALSG